MFLKRKKLRCKRAKLNVKHRKRPRVDQLRNGVSVSSEPEDGVIENEAFTPAEIVLGLNSHDLATKLAAARAGRRMLCKEPNPPIAPMVQAGIIAPLVEALDRNDCSDLQFEAAWALTNIASGTRSQTMAVVDAGAIPKLTALLGKSPAVAEQAAWALGNIAGDGPETRDSVLAHGALPAILPYMRPDTPFVHLRTVVWFYGNLCRNKKPLVKFELISPALPYISELLLINDEEVLEDICWALAHLTDRSNERVEFVQSIPNLITRVLLALEKETRSVKVPALRVLANMLTGTNNQTERCIKAGCLDHLIRFLRSDDPSIVREAAWAASNILAGTHSQIQRALEKDILTPLLNVLANGDAKCKIEAAWCIAYLCLHGTPDQLEGLVKSSVSLEPYYALLLSRDCVTTIMVLDGLDNLLQAALKYGQSEPLCVEFIKTGVSDQLEKLQEHKNQEVLKKSRHLLETYFTKRDDGNQIPRN